MPMHLCLYDFLSTARLFVQKTDVCETPGAMLQMPPLRAENYSKTHPEIFVSIPCPSR